MGTNEPLPDSCTPEHEPPPPPAVAVRDPATGRWLKGASANPAGRPRGSKRIPIMSAAESLCEELGIDLHKAVATVVGNLFQSATRGDTAAARLLLEHLAMTEQEQQVQQVQQAQQTDYAAGPQPPEGVELCNWADRCVELLEESLKDAEGLDTNRKVAAAVMGATSASLRLEIALREAREAAEQ